MWFRDRPTHPGIYQCFMLNSTWKQGRVVWVRVATGASVSGDMLVQFFGHGEERRLTDTGFDNYIWQKVELITEEPSQIC